MEKIGIENLKVVGGFVCDIANDAIASKADGKINWADAPRFFDNIFGVPRLIKSGPEVDDEWLDLDPEEEAEFEAFIASKLDLPEGAPKSIVKAVVKVIMRSSSMVKAVLELVNSIKALKA